MNQAAQSPHSQTMNPVSSITKPGAMGRFHGTGGELFLLFLKNGILTLFTLGI